MPKETKAERKVRQDWEETQFIKLLRSADNIVEAEVAVPNADGRRWRVDYLVMRSISPGERALAGEPFMVRPAIALEIQGFGFGHVGRAGWLRDIQKAQAIAANGWLYVPVTREQVGNGEALEALSRCGVKVEAVLATASETYRMLKPDKEEVQGD